jgi:hypothetical protein
VCDARASINHSLGKVANLAEVDKQFLNISQAKLEVEQVKELEQGDTNDAAC